MKVIRKKQWWENKKDHYSIEKRLSLERSMENNCTCQKLMEGDRILFLVLLWFFVSSCFIKRPNLQKSTNNSRQIAYNFISANTKYKRQRLTAKYFTANETERNWICIWKPFSDRKFKSTCSVSRATSILELSLFPRRGLYNKVIKN